MEIAFGWPPGACCRPSGSVEGLKHEIKLCWELCGSSCMNEEKLKVIIKASGTGVWSPPVIACFET